MDDLTGRELINEFVAEALDLLREVPRLLESFHQDPSHSEAIHAAFRAVHSIKGTAACLGLEAYKVFVHRLENVLAQLRDGKTPLSAPLLEVLIEGVDHLEGMLRAAGEGRLVEQLGEKEETFFARLGQIFDSPSHLGTGSNDSLDAQALQATLDQMMQLAGGPAAAGANSHSPALGQTPSSSPPRPPSQAPSEQPSDRSSTSTCSTKPILPAATRYVRIKEAYLEAFLQDLSHLFITGELLRELQMRIPESALGRALANELHYICQTLRLQLNALHRSAAALRQVSAGELFAPYPRMARSLAAQLHKKVRVLLQGEDVEIDRALARELEAPLTHLVRNAIDHGLQTPQERRARGADEIGTLVLKAQRNRHWIRISVEDDGRGIDPARLRQKAVEKGLLSPHQAEQLSEADALQLIFHPGFSTAEKVSDLSGRGVGMDVVRSVVQKHRGQVEVESKPQSGTKVHLSFPIRHAILVLDGLLVRHQDQLFVIPLEHLREILLLSPEMVHMLHQQPVVQLRGQCYELFWLHEVLNRPNGQDHSNPFGPAALVGPPGQELCLRFEELLGHRQVVIRSLEEILPDVPKIQGVALLGSGRLALVLNVPEILADCRHSASCTS